MFQKAVLPALLLASAVAQAGNGCPANSREECATLFAQQMTLIAGQTSTGMGPFRLERVSSEGPSVTLYYKGVFTKADLDRTAAERHSSSEQFLEIVRNDFVPYQCNGPIRDLVVAGIEVRNTLSTADGVMLDEFILTGCPPEA